MCSGNSKAIQSLFRKIAVFWHIISSVTGQFLLECMWVLIEEILMLLYPSENYCTDVMENEWYIEYLAYAVSNQGETMICRHLSGTWVTLKRVVAFRRIPNSSLTEENLYLLPKGFPSLSEVMEKYMTDFFYYNDTETVFMLVVSLWWPPPLVKPAPLKVHTCSLVSGFQPWMTEREFLVQNRNPCRNKDGRFPLCCTSHWNSQMEDTKLRTPTWSVS